MIQDPQATMFATADRWRALGRNVAEIERNNGVQIFARSPLGKGYTLTDAYDITQTTGRDVKRMEIKNNTPGNGNRPCHSAELLRCSGSCGQ